MRPTASAPVPSVRKSREGADSSSSELVLVRALAAAALVKAAGALLSFGWLLDSPSLFDGGVPLVSHFVAIVGFGGPALVVLLRARTSGQAATALLLACSAAAYGTLPLRLLEVSWLGGLRIEGFAALGLWLMVAELPRPVEDPRWRRLVLAAAGWSAACAIFTIVDRTFLPIGRLWGDPYLQTWDLTIPTALAALVLLTVRSIWLRSDLGPIVLVSLGPLVLQLLVESTVPAYAAWSSDPQHRALLTGLVLTALLTLPLWLLAAPSGRRGGAQGNGFGFPDSSD